MKKLGKLGQTKQLRSTTWATFVHETLRATWLHGYLLDDCLISAKSSVIRVAVCKSGAKHR
eukprot:scaffold255426_cov14-Prasinocladus_malaysianus.AAC.1